MDKLSGYNVWIMFLLGTIPDHNGLFISDYLQFSEQDMEDNHEWIQWAFPIDTVSMHNINAPLLDAHNHFSWNYYFMAQSMHSQLLDKYLNSIGIRARSYDNRYVLHNPDVFLNAVNGSHHVKRISRVLTNLMLTQDYEKAKKLHGFLNSVVLHAPTFFDSYSLAYWTNVVYPHPSIK